MIKTGPIRPAKSTDESPRPMLNDATKINQNVVNDELNVLLMAFYRTGDFASAITEGHKAEKLRPKEQLVHTNLSLFYMKSGDKVTAEKHGLQAKIESWRADAKNSGEKKAEAESGLQIAKPTPQPMKFPNQPWKKK